MRPIRQSRNLRTGILMLGVLGIPAIFGGYRWRESARQARCGANLRAVAQALYGYADDLPTGLDEAIETLIRTGQIRLTQTRCPTGETPYRFVWPPPPNMRPTTAEPLMALGTEPLSNHGDGAHVLFVDGHVTFEKAARHRGVLSASGLKPQG